MRKVPKGQFGMRFARLMSLVMVVMLLLSLSLPVYASNSDEFRVGMECGYAPFNWTQMNDANGAVPIEGTSEYANGYDVQIAKKVAESMGKKLVIHKISWEGLIPALKSEQIDAIIAGMSATEERKQEIDFSDNYYYSDLVVVVKKDSEYAKATTLNDFAGAKITAQLGTLHYNVIDQIEGVEKQTALKTFPNMIIALQSGTIDGYISERPGAISASTANDDLTFVAFPPGEGFIFDAAEVSIGIGVRKNDPIVNDINEGLKKISEIEREDIMKSAIRNQPASEDTDSFLQSIGYVLKNYGKHFLKGAGTTLFVSLIGTILGLFIGILVGTFRAAPVPTGNIIASSFHRLVNALLSIYVEVFRGTPMMVQAMVFYYGAAYILQNRMSPIIAAVIILSINTGAYMAEVVRGGIDSINKGQMEAGLAIGMTHRQTMLSVVLPQAIRNILPATGNEFVINIKDTSVFNVIALTELYYAASDVMSNELKVFEAFLIIAVIYFVLTFTVTRILHAIERKMDGPDNYALTSSTMPATLNLHQKQGGK